MIHNETDLCHEKGCPEHCGTTKCDHQWHYTHCKKCGKELTHSHTGICIDCTKENRIAVIKLRIKYPCMLMSNISRKLGISRQRVEQILKSEAMITNTRQPHFCKRCGNPVPRLYSPNMRHARYNKFCSLDCRSKDSHIPVSCEICGKITYKKKADLLRYKHSFCSNSCKGKHAGTTGKRHGKRVLVICNECGVLITGRLQSRIKNNKHNFCSIVCKGKFSIREINQRRQRIQLDAKSDGSLTRVDV